MGVMAQLLDAQTETAFFAQLARLTEQRAPTGVRVLLSSVMGKDGAALQLTVLEAVQHSYGECIRLEWEMTHVFTLNETGTLTWQHKGEIVVGLGNIQRELRCNRLINRVLEHLPNP
ncbi:MAG: hypothetical protein SF029_14540 [bacterium]|nr:hypothetical protein [bacterium]